MKKIFFFAAIAALALSSCSSDEIVKGDDPVLEEGAVNFEAYAGRETRATVNTLNEVQKQGFGVFAYDQGSASYSTYSSNSSYPNFMYNQMVHASVSSYTFPDHLEDDEYTSLSADFGEVVDYYAAESGHSIVTSGGFGTTQTPDKFKDLPEKVKALATPELADDKWEYSPIKYFNNNDGAKHSFFAYAPYDPAVKSIFTIGSTPAIRYNAADDKDILFADAHMDMEKPGVTYPIQFNFKHALSKVDMYVAPFVDAVHNDAHTTSATGVLDESTKIVVRSVKFVGTVASQGVLSLENGSWRYEATEESAYEVNDPVVLDKENNTTAVGKYKPVMTDKMVIPTLDGQPVNIQIVYDVITTDDKNSVNNSTITNTIKSKETFNLVQGKAYKFYLDLGMTSVKFNATVTGWDEKDNTNVDLPNNLPYTLIASTSELKPLKKKATSAIVKTDFTAKGDIIMSTDLKAYECTAYTSSTELEYELVTYAYIYDATGKKLYVYNGTTYDENTVGTSIASLDAITKDTAEGYYLIGDKIYYVEWGEVASATPSNRR